MKNFIIVAAVIIIGILVAIFGFGGDETDTPQVTKGETVQGEYSIKDIMALGDSYQCFIKKGDASGSVDGVVLVSGDNARAFFTLTAKNLEASFNSNFIVTEGTSYVWTSLSNLGFRLPAVKSSIRGASPAEQASIVGLEDKQEMKCEPAEPNDDSFKLPAGVTFQEVK